MWFVQWERVVKYPQRQVTFDTTSIVQELTTYSVLGHTVGTGTAKLYQLRLSSHFLVFPNLSERFVLKCTAV